MQSHEAGTPVSIRPGEGDPHLAESNKRLVLSFYEIALNGKDFDRARELVGPTYRQHNPLIEDGVAGLEKFIGFLREEFPELRAEVKRIFAEGDFVVAHVHGVRVPGQRGAAIIDIFRVEDGRLVEHWDVIQQIPDEAKNLNGMF